MTYCLTLTFSPACSPRLTDSEPVCFSHMPPHQTTHTNIVAVFWAEKPQAAEDIIYVIVSPSHTGQHKRDVHLSRTGRWEVSKLSPLLQDIRSSFRYSDRTCILSEITSIKRASIALSVSFTALASCFCSFISLSHLIQACPLNIHDGLWTSKKRYRIWLTSRPDH